MGAQPDHLAPEVRRVWSGGSKSKGSDYGESSQDEPKRPHDSSENGDPLL
jgi:hypothetical protein